MEISKFLHNPKTLELREQFLFSIQEKHQRIQSYIAELKNNNQDSAKIINLLFNEVHKLKGAGGTYGFYEISAVYFESLFTIRPAYNDKSLLNLQQLEQLTKLFDVFQKYLPILMESFNNLKQSSWQFSHKTLFFAATNRDKMFTELESCSMQDKFMFLSSMNIEESLFALSLMNPDVMLIEADIAGDNPMLIIQKALQKNCQKIYVIGDHLTNQEKFLQAGATGLIIFNRQHKNQEIKKILHQLTN